MSQAYGLQHSDLCNNAALHMKPSEFFLALDAHFRDINVQLKTAHLNGFAPHYLQGIPSKPS